MLTSELIAAIHRDYPDTQVPTLLSHINEVQRLLFSRPIPTRRIVDPSTGLDPKIDFIPGQAFYNVDVKSGFPEDALLVEKIYSRSIEYPEKIGLREATVTDPAQIIFQRSEATTGELESKLTSKTGTLVTAEGGDFFTADDVNGSMYLYDNPDNGASDQQFRSKVVSLDVTSETAPGSGEYTRVNVSRTDNDWVSQKTVVQPYTGVFFVRAYKKPVKISSPSIQLEVPEKYHFDIVYPAVQGLIERGEYGRSNEWDNFQFKNKQRFWSEQSIEDTFNENRMKFYE